ncbi:two-component sensor histidine kinase [Streptomyces sulfonofaciens]|uniref:histidine kinase n=1 Tax=Streptomyces sulfonofaciens TaxID=68272 RepID=A0A919G276_9ACTN|nr:HAMP domain-containing sensor histidine kinase [Streptomyces sulfonofaciens]GHH76697.1 two-component sensor histidine kinase [Streptomyces sulfonofaciens]
MPRTPHVRTPHVRAAHHLRTVPHALRPLLNWRSLRWKIAALVAVASCAVALAIGLLVHHSTLERSLHEDRERALTALTAAVADHRRTGTQASVTPLAELPDALARQVTATGRGTLYDDSDPTVPWEWAATRVDGQVLAVRVDAGTDLRSRQALDRHMRLASLAALAVVVPLAALAAELPNRRLRRVAGTARRIAAGDLEARTRAGGPGGDEITEIAATVDSMADSLRDRLRSEQRFTADVAHELRTPLMGLVTAAELLPESEPTELVRDRVRVLRALVEDLLEISRLDAGAEHSEPRPVALAEAVAESLDRAGLTARLSVTGAPVAETDPRRLDRIVANLVGNAHRHGGAPVDVTVGATRIEVRDHGPGFPAQLLARGPQRFFTGASERGGGHGLGLTIALGQAQVIGATLTFANAPDGGARAVLHLPPAGAGRAADGPGRAQPGPGQDHGAPGDGRTGRGARTGGGARTGRGARTGGGGGRH